MDKTLPVSSLCLVFFTSELTSAFVLLHLFELLRTPSGAFGFSDGPVDRSPVSGVRKSRAKPGGSGAFRAPLPPKASTSGVDTPVPAKDFNVAIGSAFWCFPAGVGTWPTLSPICGISSSDDATSSGAMLFSSSSETAPIIAKDN
jgi:hypothetical protein